MSNQDTLDYCKEMLTNVSKIEHIQLRNIVSRAYYFTFYELIDHVENRLMWQETNQKGGVHVRTISRLKGYPNSQHKNESHEAALELHSRITSLKKLRTKADYRMEQAVSRKVAEYSVFESELISKELAQL